MKKILFIVISICLVISLVGCSQFSTSKSFSTAQPLSTATPTATTIPIPTPTPELIDYYSTATYYVQFIKDGLVAPNSLQLNAVRIAVFDENIANHNYQVSGTLVANKGFEDIYYMLYIDYTYTNINNTLTRNLVVLTFYRDSTVEEDGQLWIAAYPDLNGATTFTLNEDFIFEQLR